MALAALLNVRLDQLERRETAVGPWVDARFCPSMFIVETHRRYVMQVRVQKWGNSLAVRIPKPLAEDAEVEEGTVLNLAVSEGKVVATPSKKTGRRSSRCWLR
jgi:virulence-associated protein VagC